jgi:hypothetical protein
MMSKYGLTPKHLLIIRQRDTVCVYCSKQMIEPAKGGARTSWATIEHLNHLPPWDNPKSVAICCQQCNSSRGKKALLVWFATPYCKERGISELTVAKAVSNYLRFGKTLTKFV